MEQSTAPSQAINLALCFSVAFNIILIFAYFATIFCQCDHAGQQSRSMPNHVYNNSNVTDAYKNQNTQTVGLRATDPVDYSLSVSHGHRFKVKYTYVDVPTGLCAKLATQLGQSFQYAFIDGTPVMNQMTHAIDTAAVAADCSSASTETLTFASN